MKKITNKSKQIDNTNTEKPIPAKNRKVWHDYYCTLSFKMKPISEAGKDIIATELRKWAEDENAFRLDDFLDKYGIRPADFYEWVKTHKNLKEAHEFTIRRIASYREKGAATRKYNDATIARTLGWYCPIAKTESERLASLRQSVGEQAGDIHVHIDAIPNSDLVPKKEIK